MIILDNHSITGSIQSMPVSTIEIRLEDPAVFIVVDGISCRFRKGQVFMSLWLVPSQGMSPYQGFERKGYVKIFHQFFVLIGQFLAAKSIVK
jgi:hypothetical protein